MILDNKEYALFISDWRKMDDAVLSYQVYSFLVLTILDKKIFKRNGDLHATLDRLIIETPIKDYLYSSRTQLLSRVIREFHKMDKRIMRENIELFTDSVTEKISNDEKLQYSNEIASKKNQSSSKDLTQKNIDLINRYRRGNKNNE